MHPFNSYSEEYIYRGPRKVVNRNLLVQLYSSLICSQLHYGAPVYTIWLVNKFSLN